MTRKLTEWPFATVKPKKSGRHMAAEGMAFPWRLNRSTISASSELIWEMSVEMVSDAVAKQIKT